MLSLWTWVRSQLHPNVFSPFVFEVVGLINGIGYGTMCIYVSFGIEGEKLVLDTPSIGQKQKRAI